MNETNRGETMKPNNVSDEGLLFYAVALVAAIVLVLDIFVWRP